MLLSKRKTIIDKNEPKQIEKDLNDFVKKKEI
jgi:hypothetical protein